MERAEGLKPPSLEITTDDFINVLNSAAFLRALFICSKETRLSGYETGFNVIISNNKNVSISNLRKGHTDSMDSEDDLDLNEVDAFLKEDQGILLSFHFHPEAEGPIIPSDHDIGVSSAIATFVGVGQVNKDGDVNILLIKQPDYIQRYPLEGLTELYLTQDVVCQNLLKDGFKNYIINFTKEGAKLKLDKSIHILSNEFSKLSPIIVRLY